MTEEDDDTLPLHILRRIAELDAAGTASAAEPDGNSVPEETPRGPSRRRTRMAAEQRSHWRDVRTRTLAAIVDLRAEQEPALQSPDLTRAALFMVPNLDQIPAMPEGKRPPEDDRSEEAEDWRSQYYSRLDALEQRRRGSRARAMKPYQTWRNLGSAGERGGKRPSQHAWPAAWTPYLLRIDPDGISGDGWATPLGVALKRIERMAAEKALPRQLWSALWAYTEPAHAYDLHRVEEALHIRRAQAYHWVEAGIRRVVAEMQAIGFGAPSAREEYRAAEKAEAEAWERETS